MSDSAYRKFYKILTNALWKKADQQLIRDGDGEKQEEKTAEWHEEHVGGGEYVHYLDYFMVSQGMYTYVKIYPDARFKYVQFILRHLHLDKAAWEIF